MLALHILCMISWLFFTRSLAEEVSTQGSTMALPTTPMDTSTKALNAVDFNTTGSPIGTGIEITTIAKETTSSNAAVNKLEIDETTPSWELIYPDQNSTLDEATMPLIDHTLSMPSTSTTMDGSYYGGVSRYFKVDDVANCEKYFGECLRQVLSKVMPKLRNSGNDTRQPLIDPFYINRTSFQYSGGPLNGRITVAFAYVYGLTSMKYRKVIFKRVSEKTFKVRLSTVIPNLLARGSYKADLKLNSVNVKPHGDFNITLYGVTIEQLAVGEFYERDQQKFLKFNSMNATAALRDAKINATGLIPDTRLNEIILNVANQYWREIFNIVLPDTRDNWSPIIRNALNGALAMVPFDFLNKL